MSGLSPRTAETTAWVDTTAGDDGAFAIAQILTKATQMEDFRMSSTRVMEAGGVALAKAFAAGTSLKRLDLKDNSLGSTGGLALAHVLAAHPRLTHVQLSETGAPSCLFRDDVDGRHRRALSAWRAAPPSALLHTGISTALSVSRRLHSGSARFRSAGASLVYSVI